MPLKVYICAMVDNILFDDNNVIFDDTAWETRIVKAANKEEAARLFVEYIFNGKTEGTKNAKRIDHNILIREAELFSVIEAENAQPEQISEIITPRARKLMFKES